RYRVGIYAGMGCIETGPALAAVAELLQAPVATSVSGKGCIPDAHPLAVGWGYGKQGTRAAEAAFQDVDLVLAVGVRYSEVSTANYAIPQPGALIHVDINPQNLGRNLPTHVCACAAPRRGVPDCAGGRRPGGPGARRAPSSGRRSSAGGRLTAARPGRSGSSRAWIRCSSWASCAPCWGPRSWCSST